MSLRLQFTLNALKNLIYKVSELVVLTEADRRKYKFSLEECILNFKNTYRKKWEGGHKMAAKMADVS